jgi:hypothetical protein
LGKLTGDDQKRAKQLESALEAALKADRWDEAITREFPLIDGVGTQVFVVVVSSKPLPPFTEWSMSRANLPWKLQPMDTVWEFDGRQFTRQIVRGDPRRLSDLPQPVDAACRALRAGPGVEAIRAVAFPVKAEAALKSTRRLE